MGITRGGCGAELIDLLDRILDRGVTVPPSARLQVAARDLRRMKARIVVECVDLYAGHKLEKARTLLVSSRRPT